MLVYSLHNIIILASSNLLALSCSLTCYSVTVTHKSSCCFRRFVSSTSFVLSFWCLVRQINLNLTFCDRFVFAALSCFLCLLGSKLLVVLDFLSNPVCLFIDHSLFLNAVMLKEVEQSFLFVAANAALACDKQ